MVLHKLQLISLPFAKGGKKKKVFQETLADLGTEGGSGDGRGRVLVWGGVIYFALNPWDACGF